MSFVKTLKRAFGFSDSEMEEEELEGIDARVTPLRDRCDKNASQMREEQPAAQATEKTDADNDTPDRAAAASADPATISAVVENSVTPDAIFESVVRIFNESLPDFLHSSVDEKSQREYLYRALDTSMKEYLENLTERAGKDCSQRFENERRSMQMEMDELRKKVQKEESDSSESKKLQLSAERQKRALNERLHELEKQLATLQAENEQYVLENKSLMNKLRVSALTGGSSDGGDADAAVVEKLEELTRDIDTLKEELSAQKELTAKAEREAKENLMALDMNRRKLASSMETWQSESTEKDELLAAARAHADKLASEVAKVKDEFGGAMINELQTKAVEARDDAEQARNELIALRSENTRLEAERASLSEKLYEANESLRVVEDMHAQLDKLEEARMQNESVQRHQKDELLLLGEQLKRQEQEKNEYAEVLAAKENTIRTLEDQTDSLRKTIENNLYEHARTESLLRAEIDRLKAIAGKQAEKQRAPEHTEETPSLISEPPIADAADTLEVFTASGEADTEKAPVPEAAEGKRKGGKRGRKPKVRISAIDETIEETDWLIATPPAGKKTPQTRQEDSNEFGYKEPDRKITPDHPAQMSLW